MQIISIAIKSPRRVHEESNSRNIKSVTNPPVPLGNSPASPRGSSGSTAPNSEANNQTTLKKHGIAPYH